MAFDPHKPECNSSGFDPIGGLGCVCGPAPTPYVLHLKQCSIASGPSRPQKTALFVPPPPPTGYYVERLVNYTQGPCWIQVNYFYDNVRHRSVKLPQYYTRESDALKAAKRVRETFRPKSEVRVVPLWLQTLPTPFIKQAEAAAQWWGQPENFSAENAALLADMEAGIKEIITEMGLKAAKSVMDSVKMFGEWKG